MGFGLSLVVAFTYFFFIIMADTFRNVPGRPSRLAHLGSERAFHHAWQRGFLAADEEVGGRIEKPLAIGGGAWFFLTPFPQTRRAPRALLRGHSLNSYG